MAETIVSTITSLLALIPTMASKVFGAFQALFLVGTTTDGVTTYANQLNALGIWAVCGMGIGMVIGIVHFAQKLFGRTR